MTRFILVRHGQTEWNREERFRGRADLILDENGLRQAAAAAQRLKEYDIAAIYSSPLRRALETAAVIARQTRVAVTSLEGLIDIDFGRWQGLSAEQAKKEDSRLFRLWREHPDRVHFPRGESLEDVRSRALAAVQKIAAEHGERAVILVTHMVVCRVLLCAVLGMESSCFWQVRQDLCAFSEFQVNDGLFSVSSVNDTCHLKGLASG